MKGKGTLIFVVIVIFGVAAAIIWFMFFRKTGTGTGGSIGSGNGSWWNNVLHGGSGTGHAGTGSGSAGTGNEPPSTSTPAINDYIGKWIKAKYDGTKLYDDDLNVVATFKAGQDIGRLSGEAVGYSCCTNNAGFYKINETTVGNSGFCRCEPVMSDASLKAILGV